MTEIAHLAATLFRKAAGRDRIVAAIAGPPGSGKSTLVETLQPLLPEGSVTIVAMDGFHFDNAVLDARGLRARKGAPESFDFAGFETVLKRIAAGEPDVAVPVFDRADDLARAGAAIVGAGTRFVLVEGNYLLLDEEPWKRLAPLVDFSVFLDVDEGELERRLVERWRDHGLDEGAARARVLSNDLPNARRVMAARRAPDLVLKL